MKRQITKLIKILRDHRLTLALGESITCGLAPHQFNTVKGTMELLKEILVCYHPDTKIKLLGISKKMIDTYSTEFTEVPNAIARKLPDLFDADICAPITRSAVAGGSETKSKPLGTVFLAVYDGHKMHSDKKH